MSEVPDQDGAGESKDLSKNTAPRFYYRVPRADDREPSQLVSPQKPSAPCVFYERIEIGRYHASRPLRPGLLLVVDPMVSARHCVIRREPGRPCIIRDTSRNGTRVDGRRLVPNLEVELTAGQTITIGRQVEFRLEHSVEPQEIEGPEYSTLMDEDRAVVTVLVGDITDYSRLSQSNSTGITHSVTRVFAAIEEEVVKLGGTIKECQGDAIIAFWEAAAFPDHALRACQAAINLRERGNRMARDSSIWDVEGFELRLDWALATGFVLLQGLEGSQATGLTMVGAPIVKASRLEKFANAENGHILVCAKTYKLARSLFSFEDVGNLELKGFSSSAHAFALVGPRENLSRNETLR